MKAPSQDKEQCTGRKAHSQRLVLKAEKFKKPTSKELRRYSRVC